MRALAACLSLAALAGPAHATRATDFLAAMEGRWSNGLQTFFAKETGETETLMAFQVKAARDGGVELIMTDGDGRRQDSDDPGPTRLAPSGRDRVALTSGAGGVCLYRVRRNKEGLDATASADCEGPARIALSADGAALSWAFKDQKPLTLRRARPFQCWAAVLRGAKHGDSGEAAKPEDWHFLRDVWIHDQGGAARVTSDETPPRSVELRLRRVEWPSGPNRPSLTLYVHEAGASRALSYAWGEYDAERLGLNLRWLQASCTHAPGVEPPS